MRRINDKFAVEYKSGYYLVIEFAKSGSESKQPGKEYIKRTQTYPSLLSAWEQTDIPKEDKSTFLALAAEECAEHLKSEQLKYLTLTGRVKSDGYLLHKMRTVTPAQSVSAVV